MSTGTPEELFVAERSFNDPDLGAAAGGRVIVRKMAADGAGVPLGVAFREAKRRARWLREIPGVEEVSRG